MDSEQLLGKDSKDTVAVIVIDNENVVVARAGQGHKLAS